MLKLFWLLRTLVTSPWALIVVVVIKYKIFLKRFRLLGTLVMSPSALIAFYEFLIRNFVLQLFAKITFIALCMMLVCDRVCLLAVFTIYFYLAVNFI